ncbi:PadR family transcriptional regulator [Paenibacillus rigui]|uniref:PadR family transcriptional regulator n=1 Tax=Paenibacillus rigui TaxID=554312 RepID=A0A229UG66_9BACL|nr:PadR family transcriptional regulator [Paenibacillus rigui]OXM82362.1 PadR family transcriptional regulator [Paenibacillus rigui]
MNTLSYGLLALLTRGPRSGYELMQHIQPIWQAKHSQIYPLLALMEKRGFVQYVPVAQKDKPDKKVYSLTDEGIAALREWVPEPTGDPVKRDEMLLKVYCIGFIEPAQARQLFEERMRMYQCKIEKYHRMLDDLGSETVQAVEAGRMEHPGFGSYILLKRAIGQAESDLDWCRWVVGLLQLNPTGSVGN